jgi:hypothetical protein
MRNPGCNFFNVFEKIKKPYMLNHSQLITLFGLSKHNENPRCRLSHDMRQLIVKIDSATFDPQSDIGKLLRHIAYGNLDAAKTMLETDPRLVLQAGHTETPSGLKVLHTTPLECALGAGDPEMAKMIAPYFDSKKISGGAKVREMHYARYGQHIENMLKQKPYDFTLLVETLMAAKAKDVMAELSLDMTHDSALHTAMEQFRKDFTPGSIISGMHFNYHHLLHALDVYGQKFHEIHESGDDGFYSDYNKNRLFTRQIIGFIQRSLPAIDRMAFARGLDNAIKTEIGIERSFIVAIENPGQPNTDFPVTGGNSSRSGLGYEYSVAGGVIPAFDRYEWGRVTFCNQAACTDIRNRFGTFMEVKHSRLEELMPQQREKKTPRCVIC